MSVRKSQGICHPPRTTFTLAHLLLKFWERYENGSWLGNETMALVKCDSAREGIPSFLG